MVMICITGREKTTQALNDRLARFSNAPLQEIRLDFADHPSSFLEIPTKQGNKAGDLIITCRTESQGGKYRGDERQRAELLARAFSQPNRLVDIEWTAGPELATFLAEKGRVIVSHHVFDENWELSEMIRILDDMVQGPAHVMKLALNVSDVARYADIKTLLHRFPQKPLVFAPMGDGASIGRVFYRFFKSPWTYVAADKENQTAAGQLCTDELENLGIDLQHTHADAQNENKLLVLLGGSQTIHSPGPPVYNFLFRKAGLPYVYLPAPTANPKKAIAALKPMGLSGAAVTMPHKDAAAGLCKSMKGPARILESINTMVLTDNGWEGFSTDGQGAVSALEDHLKRLSKETCSPVEVCVLGAGGAARAAALSLKEAGANVTLFARRPEKALKLAKGLRVKPWNPEKHTSWDVLINATPVGSRKGEEACSPLAFPEQLDLSGRVVMDMIHRPVTTTLLKDAKERGAAIVPGIEMWIHQGIEQLQLWTGECFTADMIRPPALSILKNNPE